MSEPSTPLAPDRLVLIGGGAAACAACCAPPVLAVVGIAGAGSVATIATLAFSGLVFALVVAGLSITALVVRRRRRAHDAHERPATSGSLGRSACCATCVTGEDPVPDRP